MKGRFRWWQRGRGWGSGGTKPERMYDRYYRAAQVDQGGMGTTVQLNDYLTVGMTLGLPALFCFAM